MHMTDAEVISGRDLIISEDGPWIANISLRPGMTTTPDAPLLASQRMVKILDAAIDMGARPEDGIRVLDLGTQEGTHGIAFARRGASVVTVEGRENNFRKLDFATKAIGLENIQNIRADIVQLIQDRALGEFDFIICSGILYHLPIETQGEILEYMCANSKIGFIVDSHFSFKNNASFKCNGREYFGNLDSEFGKNAQDEEIKGAVYKSIDARPSFQISRASFVNFMNDRGVRSVYELFTPIRSPSEEPALINRCCFVCVTGDRETHEGQKPPSDRFLESELIYVSPSVLKKAGKWDRVTRLVRFWKS